MAHEVFVSYSSKDKPVADAVCGALESAETRCWIAPRDIRPGASWGGSIISAIEESRIMVIVFSSSANESPQVAREVERAAQKRVTVLPFRIEALEPTGDLEYFLSTTQWLDAFTPPMENHLQTLVGAVHSILGAPAREMSLDALPAQAPTNGVHSLHVPGFAGRPAIAVLPFENLGGDPDDEYFAEGMAEDLIMRLSSYRWFPVIAGNSTFAYKGKSIDVSQLREELNVRYVVEGKLLPFQLSEVDSQLVLQCPVQVLECSLKQDSL